MLVKPLGSGSHFWLGTRPPSHYPINMIHTLPLNIIHTLAKLSTSANQICLPNHLCFGPKLALMLL